MKRLALAAMVFLAPSLGYAETFSQLPPVGSSLAGTEIVPLMQGGVTSRTTLGAMTTFSLSGLAAVAKSGNAGDLTIGTLPATRLPALTGDVTTSLGSAATTIATGAVSAGKLGAGAAAGNLANGTISGSLTVTGNISGQGVSLLGVGYNVMSPAYNAVGNGSADDTTPIQSAFTAAANGGTVQIPCGTYKITSQIAITLAAGKHLTVQGGGHGCTVLTFPSNSGIKVTYGAFTSTVTFSDMTLLAGAAGTGNPGIYVVAGFTSSNSALGPFTSFQNIALRGADGFAVTDYWPVGIRSEAISNINYSGINVTGDGGQTHGVGIYFSAASGCVTTSCSAVEFNVSQSNFISLSVGIQYGDETQGLQVSLCNFTATDFGVYAPAGEHDLTQLTVVGSQFGSTNNANNGAGISMASVVSGVMVQGNLFIINLQLTAGVSGLFTNFSIVGNAFAAVTPTNTEAIVAASGAAQGIITGNFFNGFGAAVLLQSGSHDINVQSNKYISNTANTTNSGTANVIGGGSP